MEQENMHQSSKPVEYPPQSMELPTVFHMEPLYLPYIHAETEPLEIDLPEFLDPQYYGQN
jgi:hypothetical protein